MEQNERSRHELYVKLEEVLGPAPANTLMANLPPFSWAEVATKRDLEDLRLATKQDLESGLETLEHKLSATFHAELTNQTRTMFFAIVTIVLTMSGLVFALAR